MRSLKLPKSIPISQLICREWKQSWQYHVAKLFSDLWRNHFNSGVESGFFFDICRCARVCVSERKEAAVLSWILIPALIPEALKNHTRSL